MRQGLKQSHLDFYYFSDDYENLKKQFLVYDALYAFLKLQLAKENKK